MILNGCSFLLHLRWLSIKRAPGPNEHVLAMATARGRCYAVLALAAALVSACGSFKLTSYPEGYQRECLGDPFLPYCSWSGPGSLPGHPGGPVAPYTRRRRR